MQTFFAPIAAAQANSWEGTGLAGGSEAMSAVLDLVRQHKVRGDDGRGKERPSCHASPSTFVWPICLAH